MLGEAKKIAESTGDRAALFHVARLFENLAEPNIDEAMRLYAKAGTPVMAVRLAKANQRDKDLLRYALDCNPTVLLDTARYFEGKGMIDEAVQLYQRGKQAGRALELALSQGRPDAVGVLASQLGPDSDPRLLVECAEALRAGGSLEEAMWMFIHAKRYEQALELAVQGRIPMTDDVAEKMTPAKDGGMPPADRELVLRQIAECAETSRNFQLACKKYTEAGDKERGVKALIKTGDVKKVLFYAKNSRSPKARSPPVPLAPGPPPRDAARDCRAMPARRGANLHPPQVLGLAAEFFCTLDWRELDLAATIISFYMKVRAETAAALHAAARRVLPFSPPLLAALRAFSAPAPQACPWAERGACPAARPGTRRRRRGSRRTSLRSWRCSTACARTTRCSRGTRWARWRPSGRRSSASRRRVPSSGRQRSGPRRSPHAARKRRR